eukprot:6755173-Pyramimonas_sp.AAC.1
MARSKSRVGIRRGRDRPLVMLDLCAGVARASKAFARLGHGIEMCDIKNGPAFDTTGKHVPGQLLRKIRQNLFDGAMMAPRRTTISIAHHAALRSANYPWGAPAAAEHPQLADANSITRAKLIIIRPC